MTLTLKDMCSLLQALCTRREDVIMNFMDTCRKLIPHAKHSHNSVGHEITNRHQNGRLLLPESISCFQSNSVNLR